MFPVSPEKHRVRCGIPVALAFEVEDLAEPDYVMPINEDSLDSAIADLFSCQAHVSERSESWQTLRCFRPFVD